MTKTTLITFLCMCLTIPIMEAQSSFTGRKGQSAKTENSRPEGKATVDNGYTITISPEEVTGNTSPNFELAQSQTSATATGFRNNTFLNVYCSAAGNNPSWENITNVSYAGINNTTSTHTGYSDFTAMIANVTKGAANQISVTLTADVNDYVYAFIDWDQDGVLDGAGEVYTLATATSSAG